jgi:hypothetical protein
MLPEQLVIPKRTKRISSEWLNEVLHNSGYLKECNIESISREPCGVGEGFVSDMARLTITYDKESPSLPNTMVVKMPTTFRTALAVALQYNIYEKEIRFYTEVAPISPIRVPGLIYSDYDSDTKKYILILEDCACYNMIDQVEGLDYKQTKQAIKSIANFHARWWDAPDLFSFNWISKPRDETAMSFIETFRNSWDLAKKSKEFKAYLPEDGLKIGEKLYQYFDWLMDDVSDNNLTIAHFDYRADNIFFDSENSENPIIVIDWGSPVVTTGILDIAYLLGTSMKIDLRRKYEKELIQFYLKLLEEKGISSYDFDIARYDYLKSLMVYTYLVPLGFTQLDISDPRAVELGTAYANRLFGASIDNNATSIFPS